MQALQNIPEAMHVTVRGNKNPKILPQFSSSDKLKFFSKLEPFGKLEVMWFKLHLVMKKFLPHYSLNLHNYELTYMNNKTFLQFSTEQKLTSTSWGK